MRWKPQLCLLTNVKRSKASINYNYYKNSSATFRPIIQLMHDVELNPGPDVQLDIRCLLRSSLKSFPVRILQSTEGTEPYASTNAVAV